MPSASEPHEGAGARKRRQSAGAHLPFSPHPALSHKPAEVTPGRVQTPPGPCQTGLMAMREDCRHFQSRTYSTGEVARFCVLNLAPEAPWRCPANCRRYEKDIIDG